MLGKVSGIYSLDDECDPWLPWPLGEVEGSPRPFTGQKAPVGLLGDHVCGTDEEFETGGTFDDITPLARYSASGFPECCGPPRVVVGGGGSSGRAVYALAGRYRMRGGAGASGRAIVTVTAGSHLYGGAGASGHPDVAVRPIPHLHGGAGASGRIEITPPDHIEPALGGLEIGGEVGEVYTPGYPEPGTTCETAAAIEFGTEYVYTMHGGQTYWFQVDVIAGTTYHLTRPSFDDRPSMFSYLGGDCFLLAPLTLTPESPTCREFTASISGPMRLQFYVDVGTAVLDFAVDEGPC